jgi:chromosome segregation ATPase
MSSLWQKAGGYVLVVLPVLALGGIVAIARQQQQPQQDNSQQSTGDALADAARKAREQKKEEPKPKKVFTNDDIPAATPPAAPAKDAGAKDKEKTETEPAADKGPKNDEATWRQRFHEAREKLGDAEKELDILQREEQRAMVQYYPDPQKALSEQYSRKDISDYDTKIAAKKQEIDQLKQKISDMEDELRQAGGDIGWSRE